MVDLKVLKRPETVKGSVREVLEETLSEADELESVLIVATTKGAERVVTNWTSFAHCSHALGLVEFLRLRLIEAIDR